MNDAAIELPAHFKDKTLHLFTVDKAGSSSFTFVVSRASMEAGDTVDTFATRLVSEMRKTLPRFELKKLSAREVDGEAAREIDYQWVSDGALLHQRQTVVMTPQRGDEPQAISFIGTCPKAFTAEWTEQYAGLVKSVVLRRPEITPFVPVALDAKAPEITFVLREADGSLRVFPGLTDLFKHDVTEVLDAGVTFYDATGAAMSLAPAAAGQDGWRAPGGQHYAFWTSDPARHASLGKRLAEVRSVGGLSSLSTVDAIRVYLASVAVTK
jgi:hypothetical protein